MLVSIVAGVIAVDQVAKSWALSALRSQTIDLLGPIKLELTFNSGFAFSLGAGHPALIAVISVLLVVVLAAYCIRVESLMAAVASALIVGGALSNLCDRLFRPFHGAVVDFISVPHWPIFNLADSAITIGTVLLLIANLRHGQRT
jgi:signal peptidase II